MSKNVTTTVDGNILTITINLAKKGEETKNGKNYRVAYTEGWGGFEKLEIMEGYTLSTVLLRNKDVPVPGVKKEKVAAKSVKKANKKPAQVEENEEDEEDTEAAPVAPKRRKAKAENRAAA